MKIYPVFIPHAGCPYQCLFCAQDKTTSAADIPSPAEVDHWLQGALPREADGDIAFYGGTFTALPVEQQLAYLKVAQSFIRQGRAVSIRVSTRPDAVDAKKLERLHAYDVRTIELGCQSFSDNILDSAGRGHSCTDNIAAVQMCKAFGFSVGVQLMPGLPGDTPGSAMESFHLACELQPSFLRIYPTVVVAGTGLAQLWQAGEFEPWALDTAIDVCADMLLYCHDKHIPVIRMGLQNDMTLNKNLIDGPYHPAFGQLVRARLWRRLIMQAGKVRELAVNPADYSDAVGHRCENRDWLESRLGQFSFSRDVAVPRGVLRLADQDLSFSDIPIRGN